MAEEDLERLKLGSEEASEWTVDPSRDQVTRMAGYILLLVVAGILAREVRTWDEVGDWLLPTGVLTVLALLSIVELVKISHYLLSGGDSKSEFGGLRGRASRYTPEFTVIGWAMLYPLMVYVVGFYVATPVFLFSFVYFYARNIKAAIIISSIITIFTMILFTELFNIRLEEGLFGIGLP